jgi:hypothetical protein
MHFRTIDACSAVWDLATQTQIKEALTKLDAYLVVEQARARAL